MMSISEDESKGLGPRWFRLLVTAAGSARDMGLYLVLGRGSALVPGPGHWFWYIALVLDLSLHWLRGLGLHWFWDLGTGSGA
jgi:hypothetical protein